MAVGEEGDWFTYIVHGGGARNFRLLAAGALRMLVISLIQTGLVVVSIVIVMLCYKLLEILP